ncbi:hypothetical protein Br6_04775 [Rhodococcus sp. Br-6]|nr:hypothetical protein Br6_04775 [Rhodococcus sp. Br-6]
MALPDQLPDAPIATHLADEQGAYRLLAFDFDAPRNTQREPGLVACIADAVAFTSTLGALGIPHLTTASGSPHGRHVWVRLNEAVTARTIRTLAKLVRELYPTLDIAPLTNPRTGCVRIPGSAHRRGGVSEPISANDEIRLEQLASFSTGAHSADLRRLRVHLRSQLHMLQTAGTPAPARPRAARSDVSPYETLAGPAIVGTRSALPGNRAAASESRTAVRSAALTSALAVPVDPRADHSRRAFSLLTRMAAAGWTRSDVLTAVDTEPGLEYLRTARCGDTARVARPDTVAFALRQWDRATTQAAAWTSTRQADSTVASAGVRRALAIQKAADAVVAPWTGHAGVHRRSVLDALCLLACETGALEVDIDQRRLALTAGVTQPTASRALKFLRDTEWVSRTARGTGTEADRYKLAMPTGLVVDESQGEPTPEELTSLPGQLHTRLLHARHDLWTRDGLGSLCGFLHRLILAGTQTVSALVQASGLTVSTVREHRDLLIAHGLLNRSGRVVRRLAGALLAAAKELGVVGVVEARRRLYTAQSIVWEWWNAEMKWRTAATDCKPWRSDHPLRPLRRRFPTLPDGRADFATAMGRILAALPASLSGLRSAA